MGGGPEGGWGGGGICDRSQCFLAPKSIKQARRNASHFPYGLRTTVYGLPRALTQSMSHCNDEVGKLLEEIDT